MGTMYSTVYVSTSAWTHTPSCMHTHTGRRHQFTGVAVRGTDTKIKSLLKMKRQLIELLNKPYGGPGDLCKLPDDCLRHIISHLSDPKDVLNLGQTAM